MTQGLRTQFKNQDILYIILSNMKKTSTQIVDVNNKLIFECFKTFFCIAVGVRNDRNKSNTYSFSRFTHTAVQQKVEYLRF